MVQAEFKPGDLVVVRLGFGEPGSDSMARVVEPGENMGAGIPISFLEGDSGDCPFTVHPRLVKRYEDYLLELSGVAYLDNGFKLVASNISHSFLFPEVQQAFLDYVTPLCEKLKQDATLEDPNAARRLRAGTKYLGRLLELCRRFVEIGMLEYRIRDASYFATLTKAEKALRDATNTSAK